MGTRGLEQLVASISDMGRAELIRTLRTMPCGFELDFTEEHLESLTLDRLRHIVLAASVQSERVAHGA